MIPHLAIAAATGTACLGMAIWGRYRDWVWYDNLAHFFGGACIAALAASTLNILSAIALTIGVALAWEVFEWRRDIHPWGGNTTRDAAWEDTALDLFMVREGAFLSLITLYLLPS